MLSGESLIDDRRIDEINSKITDEGLISFALKPDCNNQLSQTHPLLSGILRSIVSAVKSQNKLMDKMMKSHSETNTRTLLLTDALEDLKTQFVDFRAETQVDICNHIKRRPKRSVEAGNSSSSTGTTSSSEVPPEAKKLQAPSPTRERGAGAPPAFASVTISRVSQNASISRDDEGVMESENSFRTSKPYRSTEKSFYPVDVRVQQEQLNQDIDQLIADVNQNFDVTNKNINRELDELNKAFYDALAVESEAREKQMNEFRQLLEKEHNKQLDNYAEIFQEQNRKIEAVMFNVDRMQADLFELRSVVYAQKTKLKPKDNAPVFDFNALTADLAKKVERTELQDEITKQETTLTKTAKELKQLTEKFDALNEIFAIGTGGKLFADALELRFGNLTNELYRLDKLKIGREEVLEMLQKRLNEAPTCLSVKCLSCSQSVDMTKEANTQHKLQEFPPSTLTRTKPVAQMSPSAGNNSFPEGAYFNEMVIKVEGATEDSTPSGYPTKKQNKKAGSTPPLTKAFLTHGASGHGRNKLQEYYDWMKSNHNKPTQDVHSGSRHTKGDTKQRPTSAPALSNSKNAAADSGDGVLPLTSVAPVGT